MRNDGIFLSLPLPSSSNVSLTFYFLFCLRLLTPEDHQGLISLELLRPLPTHIARGTATGLGIPFVLQGRDTYSYFFTLISYKSDSELSFEFEGGGFIFEGMKNSSSRLLFETKKNHLI